MPLPLFSICSHGWRRLSTTRWTNLMRRAPACWHLLLSCLQMRVSWHVASIVGECRQRDFSMDDEEHTGRAIGGKARMNLLTPEERRDQARRAAAARWSGDIKQATHGSDDHPLKIGDVEIRCYVLEDGRRVLQQTGLISALNMSHGGSYSKGGDRLAKFATQGRLKPFASNELIERTAEPIRLRHHPETWPMATRQRCWPISAKQCWRLVARGYFRSSRSTWRVRLRFWCGGSRASAL